MVPGTDSVVVCMGHSLATWVAAIVGKARYKHLTRSPARHNDRGTYDLPSGSLLSSAVRGEQSSGTLYSSGILFLWVQTSRCSNGDHPLGTEGRTALISARRVGASHVAC